MKQDEIQTSISQTAEDLAHITELAGDPNQKNTFLRTAIMGLCEALQFELIVALDFRNGLLHPQTWYRSDGQDINHLETLNPKLLPQFQKVLEQRKIVNYPCLHNDKDVSFMKDQLSQSRLIVPMVSAQFIQGVLVLESKLILAKNDSVLHLATAYAHIIANSLALVDNINELEASQKKLINQNRTLQNDRDQDDDANYIVLEYTLYPDLKSLVETAKMAARSDVSILITGETGTGKDVLARALHRWSNRYDKPFIKINCAALPHNLIESELFGHVKGSFSGAVSDRAGRFEVADGGTLLLDEIGDLPLETQSKLLRVLQEGTFQAVGSDNTTTCDVRIIAATNLNLITAIEEGTFREDLFFRLNVVTLEVPPLRNRINDVPLLAQQILKNIQRRTGRGPWSISETNMRKLLEYNWPGNIRELANVIERGRVFSPQNGSIPIKLENTRLAKIKTNTASHWPTFTEHQRKYIIEALQHTKGKIYGKNGAAALLDMPPTTLSSKIQRLDIDPQKYRR